MLIERYYIIVTRDIEEFDSIFAYASGNVFKYLCKTRTGFLFFSDDKSLAHVFYNEYKCRDTIDRLKREYDNVHMMMERIEVTID